VSLGRRYRTIQTVGQGAGGEVSLVADQLQGGRQVALKRIAGGMDEPGRAALAREFSTLASLALPGVAPVFDFGLVADGDVGSGEAFFTRGFVDGRPLDLAAGELPPDARVRLFARVAARVGALHRAGVVHGDIKPANVIVDAAGDAHLIDFGLASAVGSMAGAVGGTPAFMAPELFDGVRPSSLSDVYALGCTLWMLITGSPPKADRHPRRNASGRASDPPIIPPGVSVTSASALVVAQRALCRDPSDRFPTVGEFLAALDRVIPSSVAAVAGWVAPRARGHGVFTDALRSAVDELGVRGGTVLVEAAAGGGKTTLLRSIKWQTVAYHSGIRGSWTNTRSPFATPNPAK
jgi:serine/threonine-protein kinase